MMMNKLKHLVWLCFALGVVAPGVAAQTAAADPNRTADTQSPPPGATSRAPRADTSIDENFELNIDLRRITERDYQASTAVELGDANGRGVNLQVGVAVAASQIDVLLRNIRGRVRFRATLEPLLRRINSRRAGTTVDPATGSSGSVTPE